MSEEMSVPIIDHLCYCTCGGVAGQELLKKDPDANVGRLLIICACCDRKECPEHPPK